MDDDDEDVCMCYEACHNIIVSQVTVATYSDFFFKVVFGFGCISVSRFGTLASADVSY